MLTWFTVFTSFTAFTVITEKHDYIRGKDKTISSLYQAKNLGFISFS